MLRSPVVLLILDGVGWGRRDEGDAVFLATTPILDALMERYPWGLLQAHGTAVGMPSDDDMGNSEVGHNAMGAGRVFDQGAKLVNAAIATGAIWASTAWQEVIGATRTGGTLHLLGLVSNGNVHSHIDHLDALIARAQQEGVTRLRVHALSDGRDVAPRSALRWFQPLEERLRASGLDYAIASGGGRMRLTMDRYEADWGMVERGWRCHVHGEGRRFASASEAVEAFYAEDPDVNDQYLPAFVVGDFDGMEDGDAVVLFNFRGDRAIEISRAFTEAEGIPFDRARSPGDSVPSLLYAGMMEYDGDRHSPPRYLVTPPVIVDTVADRLAQAGKRSFAISETQKFGHVTFFFNGNRSDPPPGERQIEVASLRVPFDQAPKMSAAAVAEEAVQAIGSGEYDHVRINLANGDMVGHTGDLAATIEAVEELDRCLGRVLEATRQAHGALLLTADHGNAEEMYRLAGKGGGYARDPEGQPIPSTSHSLNPVPVLLADFAQERIIDAGPFPERVGGLAQIGSTVLDLCGLPVPSSYLPSLLRPPSAP